MKIYTKKGDSGSTSLLGKSDVLKSDERVDAYGTVDELNAQIGQLVAGLASEQGFEQELEALNYVQNRLFVIGSYLACVDENMRSMLPPLKSEWSHELESQIDSYSEALPEQKEFILPGGHPLAALTHVCRTVCRRAERRCVALDSESPDLITYLNRLSDYFHLLARHLNAKFKVSDHTWIKE